MSRRTGRPPKPTELKLIEGNPGKRKLIAPPKAPPARPQCPSWLSDYAKTEWHYIVPVLDELGLLTKVDRAVLAGFCEAVSIFRAATEALNDSTILVKSSGRIAKNPVIQIQRDARRDMLAYAGALGLSPSDRGRLLGSAAPNPGRTGLEGLIAQ